MKKSKNITSNPKPHEGRTSNYTRMLSNYVIGKRHDSRYWRNFNISVTTSSGVVSSFSIRRGLKSAWFKTVLACMVEDDEYMSDPDKEVTTS